MFRLLCQILIYYHLSIIKIKNTVNLKEPVILFITLFVSAKNCFLPGNFWSVLSANVFILAAWPIIMLWSSIIVGHGLFNYSDYFTTKLNANKVVTFANLCNLLLGKRIFLYKMVIKLVFSV